MLRSIRILPLMLSTAFGFIACTDDNERIEEPIDAHQDDSDAGSFDEIEGSSVDSSAPSEAVPGEPIQDDESSESMDEESSMSEPEGASPGAAPSEKGGIISSGVKKEKKRCRLISDELERRKCIREQAQ